MACGLTIQLYCRYWDMRWCRPAVNVHCYTVFLNCSLSSTVQSIIVFCPKVGLSLQTQHSPLYLLLSRLFVSSNSPFIIMLSTIWYLLPRTFFPFIIPSRSSFSRQFLLSQWPSQFRFIFVTSSIILPSPTLSSTTVFFCPFYMLHPSPYPRLKCFQTFLLTQS